MRQFSLVILLLFITISATAQSKIGTVDADYILGQMPEYADVNKGLETYNKELQNNLQETIKNYEALVKDYQDTNASLTDTIKKEKETKIIELENDIKSFRQKASVMFEMKRNELTKPLYQKIDNAMTKVIEEEGFTQIFNAGTSGLVFSRIEDDITEKVMKKMGIEPKPATTPAEN